MKKLALYSIILTCSFTSQPSHADEYGLTNTIGTDVNMNDLLNERLIQLNQDLNPGYGPGHWGYQPVTGFSVASADLMCYGKGFSKVCKKSKLKDKPFAIRDSVFLSSRN